MSAPTKRGGGRPRIGTRYLVTLDDESVRILTELGQGNLSAGIRLAAQMVAHCATSSSSAASPAKAAATK